MMQSNSVRWVALGDYIEPYKNKCGDNLAIVSGVDINKQFILTRANLEGVDVSKYYLVPPRHFACNLMHIGRDERIPIALNTSENDLIVTSAYHVFRVKKERCSELLDDYLFAFFNSTEIDRLAWFYTDSSIRGNLKEARFGDIKFPLPSIDKQQEIIEAWRGLREMKEENERIAEPLESLCRSYIQDLKYKYPLTAIGTYIEPCDERNNSLAYDINCVRGLATSKQIITTKANLDGVSLSSYRLLKSKEFAFVADTSRRGEKMSLGFNQTDEVYLVSSISSVFKVKDENELLPDYLYLWFCRSEFDRYTRFNSWGSAREVFSYDEMTRVKIPLPPIEIQKAIVAIYRCADESRKIAAQANALSTAICPALMQKVING